MLMSYNHTVVKRMVPRVIAGICYTFKGVIMRDIACVRHAVRMGPLTGVGGEWFPWVYEQILM